MTQKQKISLFWFRRDLRLEDNVGLSQALNSGFPVLPLFIFDTGILRQLENKKDRRVDYFHQALQEMHTALKAKGSALRTFRGIPLDVFKRLTAEYDVQAVYCNRDYEPAALERDTAIDRYFQTQNIPFRACKDQVIFDKNEIVKSDGTPYTVYTPYAKKWRESLQPSDYQPVGMNWSNLLPQDSRDIHSLHSLGFKKTDMAFEKPSLQASIIDQYDKTRDFPAQNGTTYLGMALRFGTISIRRCVAFALMHNQIWLSELIWREFFMQILYHFPKVVRRAFKPKYDLISWRNNEEDFEKWCEGKTGFPLVDAGIRQLNQTGYMHNRVRMAAASFLVKDLLIDWRWGEAYFAEKLNDYDLSANNGNWQWAAGCGCDAAPYFRIFNPATQLQRFDKDLIYVRTWIPEFGSPAYPHPMVDHKAARERALAAYSKAVQGG